MPRGDGSGPPRNSAQRGGRMQGNRAGSGVGGNCVCPSCGTKVPHQQANPCNNVKCPKCGTGMVRQ
ncbi:MAG: hypothetical protein PHE15_02420 [Dehalococcoidales bacterium]|jgi:hypothetical protein|nr:hypothetical protein [Dehalococcoidales bacterium]